MRRIRIESPPSAISYLSIEEIGSVIKDERKKTEADAP